MANLKLWNFHQLADEKRLQTFQEWHVSRKKQLFVSNSDVYNTLLAKKLERNSLDDFNAPQLEADGHDSLGWQRGAHFTWQRRCCPLVMFFSSASGLLGTVLVQFRRCNKPKTQNAPFIWQRCAPIGCC
jgi:hypothetical protein